MENEELRQIIELKAKNYFDGERQKFGEWRINRMLTKGEHRNLMESLEKNEKMFYSLLNDILKWNKIN